jgi:hypothetical protein
MEVVNTLHDMKTLLITENAMPLQAKEGGKLTSRPIEDCV